MPTHLESIEPDELTEFLLRAKQVFRHHDELVSFLEENCDALPVGVRLELEGMFSRFSDEIRSVSDVGSR